MRFLNKLQITFLVFLLFLPFSAQTRDITTELQQESTGSNLIDPTKPFEVKFIDPDAGKLLPTPAPAPTGAPAPIEKSQSGSRTILPLKPSTNRTPTISLPNPLKATSFAELINRITNWLLIIGAPILVLMIIIGAFQIMTGAGNPENITKGRHTITWAIIGYALLLLSSGITLIIEQLLGIKK